MAQTLYYGTDSRLLTLDYENRQRYEDMCKLIAVELYKKFLPSYTPTNNRFAELFEEKRMEINSDFLKDLADSMFLVRINSMFGHIDGYNIYDARLLACAAAINSFAGGELGKAAYILIVAAEKLGWLDWPSGSTENIAVKIVKLFAETEPQPVILSFPNARINESEEEKLKDECISYIKLNKEEFLKFYHCNSDRMTVEKICKDKETELIDEKNRLPYLLHGTDARIIRMAPDERNDYFSCCKLVIDHLWNLFKPLFSGYEKTDAVMDGKRISVETRKIERYKNLFDSQGKTTLYNNLIQKLWMIETSQSGNQQYQYGELYLTSNRMKAQDYALGSFAGGELGLIAHRLISAAELMKLDGMFLDKNVNSAIEKIEAFATDLDGRSPVIIKVPNIDPTLILTDEGKTIDWFSQKHIYQDFRYINNDIELDLNYAEYIKK